MLLVRHEGSKIIVMKIKGDHCKHTLMEFKIVIKLNIGISLQNWPIIPIRELFREN